MADGNFIPVTNADAITENGFSCFRVGELAIVICRRNGEFFALKNECTHALASFEDGIMRGYRLICPLHGGTFDIRDGSPLAMPARRPLRTFPARVTDGVVEVEVDES